MSDLVKEYSEEFDKDVEVDRITLMSQMETGAISFNKWSFRHYQHETRLAKLVERRDDLVIDAETALEESNDSRFKALRSKTAKDKFISQTEVVRDIDKKISAEKRIVDYLKLVLTNCQWVYSKNLHALVELIKVEAIS